jgi:hypothetical protein
MSCYIAHTQVQFQALLIKHFVLFFVSYYPYNFFLPRSNICHLTTFDLSQYHNAYRQS